MSTLRKKSASKVLWAPPLLALILFMLAMALPSPEKVQAPDIQAISIATGTPVEANIAPAQASPAATPSIESRAALTTYVVPAGPYTIGWISDTQRYSASYKEVFPVMTKYLRDERDELNLGYVAITGDIVNKGSSRSQWQTAKNAMDLLEPLPYGVLAGNHDRDARGDYTSYKKYFGENQFSRETHYGGSYKDNLAHYDMITLGKTNYLFLYLSYQPNAGMIEWANSIFQAHSDRVGVLCVHDYFDSKARLRVMGETLQKEIVAKNSNIFLVLCGHRYTEACIPAYFDDDGNGKDDRTVYQCIANYQTLERGGLGYIRFLEIDEGEDSLRFYTYSPLLDDFGAPPSFAVNTGDTWPLPW